MQQRIHILSSAQPKFTNLQVLPQILLEILLGILLGIPLGNLLGNLLGILQVLQVLQVLVLKAQLRQVSVLKNPRRLGIVDGLRSSLSRGFTTWLP